MKTPKITHHGAIEGVTGSCHQYEFDTANLIIDCGLFQGSEANTDLADFAFEPSKLTGLVVTHCHIDHVGRIPWLIAAGFRGPIYCSEPTSALLPLILEDALSIQMPDNDTLVLATLTRICDQLVPMEYNQWLAIENTNTQLRLQNAGHILGSAYVEIQTHNHVTVFSGDLGAPGGVFVDPPKPPTRADILVIESTYGHKNHEHRLNRQQILADIIEHALANGGTVLIPAFSLGRTQEVLSFISEIIESISSKNCLTGSNQIPIILDSPLAQRLTQAYRQLSHYWPQTLQQKRKEGQFPLAFDQLITVEDHKEHKKLVKRLSSTNQPSVVIAASGMCQGGRITNYLESMLSNKHNDVLFIGYQAEGTLGRDIQRCKSGEQVSVHGKKTPVNAGIYTISGFSAHADQSDLLDFVTGITEAPQEVRIVHGSDEAKCKLKEKLSEHLPKTSLIIPIIKTKPPVR